ncbi:hypothetical protein CTAYLR_001603 [Chrysophaeum taylorii]|uniref:Laminin IV type A domain-containing protein n=1 Tax=Chrysophaeum taylorii TaxID=2483200 RepID=A0AAD7XN90_9STRA|nr:hypothetical protein CTAYLR_001603 [Chrysophaeum taylorii]
MRTWDDPVVWSNFPLLVLGALWSRYDSRQAILLGCGAAASVMYHSSGEERWLQTDRVLAMAGFGSSLMVAYEVRAVFSAPEALALAMVVGLAFVAYRLGDKRKGNASYEAWHTAWHGLIVLGQLMLFAAARSRSTSTEGAVPIARHQTVVVEVGRDAVITLRGYDTDGDVLRAQVVSLPESGTLSQLSSVFSKYAYEPKRGKAVVAPSVVTGSKNRVYYARPEYDAERGDGKWGTFEFAVSDGSDVSRAGRVTLVPPSLRLVVSCFDASDEGWRIVRSRATVPTWDAASFGKGLNRFVVATDDLMSFADGTERNASRWMFEAPSAFHGQHNAAYAGKLKFTLGALAGDFENEAPPRHNLVELECETCRIRLAFPLWNATTPFTGKTTTFSIDLVETAGWIRDPNNDLLPWPAPSQCAFIHALSSISALRILGDFTDCTFRAPADIITNNSLFSSFVREALSRLTSGRLPASPLRWLYVELSQRNFFFFFLEEKEENEEPRCRRCYGGDLDPDESDELGRGLAAVEGFVSTTKWEGCLFDGYSAGLVRGVRVGAPRLAANVEVIVSGPDFSRAVEVFARIVLAEYHAARGRADRGLVLSLETADDHDDDIAPSLVDAARRLGLGARRAAEAVGAAAAASRAGPPTRKWHLPRLEEFSRAVASATLRRHPVCLSVLARVGSEVRRADCFYALHYRRHDAANSRTQSFCDDNHHRGRVVFFSESAWTTWQRLRLEGEPPRRMKDLVRREVAEPRLHEEARVARNLRERARDIAELLELGDVPPWVRENAKAQLAKLAADVLEAAVEKCLDPDVRVFLAPALRRHLEHISPSTKKVTRLRGMLRVVELAANARMFRAMEGTRAWTTLREAATREVAAEAAAAAETTRFATLEFEDDDEASAKNYDGIFECRLDDLVGEDRAFGLGIAALARHDEEAKDARSKMLAVARSGLPVLVQRVLWDGGAGTSKKSWDATLEAIGVEASSAAAEQPAGSSLLARTPVFEGWLEPSESAAAADLAIAKARASEADRAARRLAALADRSRAFRSVRKQREAVAALRALLAAHAEADREAAEAAVRAAASHASEAEPPGVWRLGGLYGSFHALRAASRGARAIERALVQLAPLVDGAQEAVDAALGADAAPRARAYLAVCGDAPVLLGLDADAPIEAQLDVVLECRSPREVSAAPRAFGAVKAAIKHLDRDDDDDDDDDDVLRIALPRGRLLVPARLRCVRWGRGAPKPPRCPRMLLENVYASEQGARLLAARQPPPRDYEALLIDSIGDDDDNWRRRACVDHRLALVQDATDLEQRLAAYDRLLLPVAPLDRLAQAATLLKAMVMGKAAVAPPAVAAAAAALVDALLVELPKCVHFDGACAALISRLAGSATDAVGVSQHARFALPTLCLAAQIADAAADCEVAADRLRNMVCEALDDTVDLLEALVETTARAAYLANTKKASAPRTS